MRTTLVFLVSIVLTPYLCGVPAAHADTYRVGPGRAYATLQEVVSLLDPGDVVEVDGDAIYPGDVIFRRGGTAAHPIVIRGLPVNGKRPIISGGTNTLYFRTDDIGEGADHYLVEGLEVTGGSNRCIFHQSHDLTLRSVVVRDCPAQGILGADWGSGSITIEHSEVHGCGNGGYDHQIYIGMDEDNYPNGVFRLQHSWIHDGNGGNNVKSRAARNEIYYNRIEGAYYHELELIGAECCAEGVVREDSDVVGNLIIKKPPPHGPHADFFAVRLGGDGTAQTWGRYRFVNNTFITGADAVFRLFDGMETLEAHNNIFYRYGGLPVNMVRAVEVAWRSGSRIAGSTNWVTTGTINVPSTWTGTRSGADPGFADPTVDDFSLVAGSPAIGGATTSPSGPPGYPFPNPLFSPAFHPPGTPGLSGTPRPRPADGDLDIGAYEFATLAPGPPFGSFDTPAHGSTGLTGAVAVTGWALDDGGVEGVALYRSPITNEGPAEIYIGEAVFIAGSRPDVEALYPDYPDADRAGWGYMLLSNMLPGGGNGTYVLHAHARDTGGRTTRLGSKTVGISNSIASTPFGTLDTPAQGATVSGSAYPVWGWVLTPQPGIVPITGTTIRVFIDGVRVGQPIYNVYRSDIATLFPGYANSNGAVGYYILDTSTLSNGLHTIAWSVGDSLGRGQGIGSRYFWVEN